MVADPNAASAAPDGKRMIIKPIDLTINVAARCVEARIAQTTWKRSDGKVSYLEYINDGNALTLDTKEK